MSDAPPCTIVSVSTTIAAPPVRVWEVLTMETERWWLEPYLAPGRAMRMDAALAGAVWAAPTDEGADVEQRSVHGTIRHFDPPRRLEIGGVLVATSFGGHITFTVAKTQLGCDLTVEHEALGVDDDAVESTLVLGWTQLLERLGEIAEA